MLMIIKLPATADDNDNWMASAGTGDNEIMMIVAVLKLQYQQYGCMSFDVIFCWGFMFDMAGLMFAVTVK